MLKYSFHVTTLVLIGSAMLLRGQEPVPPTAAQPKSTAVRAREMRSKLAMPGPNLDKGGEQKTKFQDAVDFFSDTVGVLILIDSAAFRTDLQIENVGEQPSSLPKMAGLKLSTMLAKLAGTVGGTYLVLPDHILITTPARTNPLAWTDGDPLPTVDAEFSKAPLEDALSELSDLTGINIVLDARQSEKRNNPVTAKFSKAPISTAARLLADMADLEAVAIDGAFYVTTRENAKRLRAEQESRPKRYTGPVAMNE